MSEGLEVLNVLVDFIKEFTLGRVGLFVDRSYNIIEKELKALEIIKNKRVNVDFLLDCKSLMEYNNSCLQFELDRVCLTQEEFDLLKEVLL